MCWQCWSPSMTVVDGHPHSSAFDHVDVSIQLQLAAQVVRLMRALDENDEGFSPSEQLKQVPPSEHHHHA